MATTPRAHEAEVPAAAARRPASPVLAWLIMVPVPLLAIIYLVTRC